MATWIAQVMNKQKQKNKNRFPSYLYEWKPFKCQSDSQFCFTQNDSTVSN